jgi:hypothetical protein
MIGNHEINNLYQGFKNETKRNGIFSETKRNEKYLRKQETKINETKFKETKLKRNNNSVSRKKNNNKKCVVYLQEDFLFIKLLE